MRNIRFAIVFLSLALMVSGVGVAASTPAEQWVCPMPEHAEVFAAPGLCPACGMQLVPKSELDVRMQGVAEAAAGRGAGSDLKPPASGKIRVAFAITEHATMMDFTGPWEVFQDVDMPGRGTAPEDAAPFELYTVSSTREPIPVSGGMRIVPDYTFAEAPTPDVIIVPAQHGSEELLAWLRKMQPQVDVLAAVCAGAYQLARAGLLDGKEATTHPDFYTDFAKNFPKVKLVPDRRFVEADRVVATSGGVIAGVDLALHIVVRYFGREVAARTAEYMQHRSKGWDVSG